MYLEKGTFVIKWKYLTRNGEIWMEVQLKVKVASTLKEEATLKAKAEGKSMKQVIEELLTTYVGGQEEVQLTPQVEYQEGVLKPEDFENRLDYVDYLERTGLIY